MSENHVNLALGRLYPLFNIKSGDKETTVQFKNISHDDLCHAILNWLEQNRLILVEPINTFITHGLREEGVDVVLNFATSNVKIGFQVKSYGDVKNNEFTRTVKRQITSSKKHGLDRLFICLCGDLTDERQLRKMQGVSSEISEINKKDDYIYLLSPLKMIQIYEAFKEKIHPLRYVPNIGAVRVIMESILEALSDDPLYVTTIKFEHKLREEIDIPEGHHNLRLSLKDGAFDDGLTLIDKLKESQITGESFKIPGRMIEDLVIDDEVINFDPKTGFMEIKPELRVLLPSTVFTEDENGERIQHYDNIIFVLEKVVDGVIHLRSKKDDNLIEFRVSVDRNSNKTTISIKYYFEESDVKQNLHFLKFQNELLAGKLLVFSHEQGEMGGKITIAQLEPSLSEWLELFEKLSFIQDTIGKPIYLENMPDHDSIYDLLTLYDLLTEGETQKIIFNPVFKLKKRDLMRHMDVEDGQKIINYLKFTLSEFGFSMFNYDIVLGDAVCEIDKMTIDEDKTNLDNLSQMADDEEIEITLKIYEESKHKLSIETLNLKVTENKDED